MSNQTKTTILIILGFLLSLFLFELIIGCGDLQNTVNYASNEGYGGPFIVFTSFVLSGIYHALFIGVIAIILRFTNVNRTYKKIVAYLPVYSIVLTLPMMLVACEVAGFFHLYGLG